MIDLIDVIEQFNIRGSLKNCCPYGHGHINDTYKVVLDYNEQSKTYIIQRINHNVFKNIDGLMNNIVNVLVHIRRKVLDEGGRPEEILNVILSKDGENHVRDKNGDYYRCYNFISSGISIETKPIAEELYASGVGYGKFQNYLRDFPVQSLYETIPDFHNTIKRLDNLKKVIEIDTDGRVSQAKSEIDFYLSRSHYAPRVIELLNEGRIPYRVTHNDTKLNNILIDVKTNRPVAAIDLDTVMPGSIVYDFGDSIRSGANRAAEDEKDIEKVSFSLEHYKDFADGFIGQIKDILTIDEVKNMAFGAILMTYECGMRFLTDYLQGDKYFKTKYSSHNLVRARTQIKLIQDMEKELDSMNNYIFKLCRD